MFFGTEFFIRGLSFEVGVPGFFGESDLMIPENLFDLLSEIYAPVIFVPGSDPEVENEPVNCDYFSEIFYNFELNAEIFPELLRENLFDSNYLENSNLFLENYLLSRFDSKEFARSFSEIFDLYGNYFYENKEFFGLSNGFARGFERFCDFCGSNYFDESASFIFSQSYFGKMQQGFEITRKISGIFNNSLNFSEFNSRELEKIKKFSETLSEKNNEIIDFFQSRFFDFYRGSVLTDPYFLSEKNDVIFERNFTKKVPENIYFAAAKSNHFEKAKPGTEVIESLSSGLNRRVEQLEKIVRGNKIKFGTDYDSVVRRLELELRSALNSCCEGVHF